MTDRPPSLRRLALVLSLPLVLLAAMGLWVWNAERDRAMAGLRKDAIIWGRALAEEAGADTVVQIIAGQGVRVPRWQWDGRDPPASRPVAQRWEAARDLLHEGKSEEAAAELRLVLATATPQDVTAAGLPLLPMVQRTLLEAAPTEANADSLCARALTQPSMLTTRLIEDAMPFLPENQRKPLVLRAGRAEEFFRLVRARRPGNLSSPAGWHCEVTDTEFVRCTQLDSVREAVENHTGWLRENLPSWAGMNVTWNGHSVLEAPGEELAAVTRPPWRFAITFAAPERFTGEFLHRQQRLAGVLGAAVVVTALALALAYRGFKKQSEFSRLQSEFVASVSHELRTPVASIGVLAERLGEGKADPEQTAQYHQFIAREGRRLAGLVDNVLDFSRIERGAKRYELEHADLPRLVRETAALMRPQAAEKGITLTENIQDVPEALWPPVDAVAIRQALVNLLDNALKFTPGGGGVFIGFGADNGHVTLSVRDTGIGIPPHEHAKIFERFHRVDNGLRRETTGAGIGLSLVKHIAEAHGAALQVESREREGAVFSLRFPASSNHRSSHAPAAD